jgi:hypothetical protein
LGRAWVVTFGLKLFRAFQFKNWAFKIWAVITGLKIYKTSLNKTSKKISFRPFGPEVLNFSAYRALAIFLSGMGSGPTHLYFDMSYSEWPEGGAIVSQEVAVW